MIGTCVALFLLAALSLAAGGTGRYVSQRLRCSFTCHTEELAFAWAVGFASLMLAVLALGLCHLLYSWTLGALVIGWMLVGSRQILLFVAATRRQAARLRPAWRSYDAWLLALVGLGMALLLVRALAPPFGPTDPLAYQLALPKVFLRRHYFSFEPSITGALYPTNMGLLYVVALALWDGVLAQALHWLMAALCLVALIGFGTRYFTRRAGLWAAAIFGCVPIVVVFAPLGYVDVGLCFYQLVAWWAVLNWVRQPHRGMLVLAGLLTGIAMGTKHQGMATLALGLPVVLASGLAQRRGAVAALRVAGLYAGLALAVACPWYLRSWVAAGNPIWPLANGFFGGRPFGLAPEILVSTSADPYAVGWRRLALSVDWIRRLWPAISPWAWTWHPDGWQKAIGPCFAALLPAALLQLRERRVRWLLGFCLLYYLAIVRVLHANPRYGLVVFAALSLACGYGAVRLLDGRLGRAAWLLRAGFAAVLVLNLAWEYSLAEGAIPVVAGRQTAASFLQAQEPTYRVWQVVNERLPPSATVLLQGEVKGYYADRAYVWDHPYQGALDYSTCRTPEDLLERLRQLGITHIVRIMHVPPYRSMYPQYFEDPFHEAFRRKYLKALYYDESYVLFEVLYRARTQPP